MLKTNWCLNENACQLDEWTNRSCQGGSFAWLSQFDETKEKKTSWTRLIFRELVEKLVSFFFQVRRIFPLKKNIFPSSQHCKRRTFLMFDVSCCFCSMLKEQRNLIKIAWKRNRFCFVLRRSVRWAHWSCVKEKRSVDFVLRQRTKVFSIFLSDEFCSLRQIESMGSIDLMPMIIFICLLLIVFMLKTSNLTSVSVSNESMLNRSNKSVEFRKEEERKEEEKFWFFSFLRQIAEIKKKSFD